MDAEIIIIKRPARNAEYKILHIIPPCDLKEPAFGKGTRIDKAILAFFFWSRSFLPLVICPSSAIYATATRMLLFFFGALMELDHLFHLKLAGEGLMHLQILAENLMHSGIGLPRSIE